MHRANRQRGAISIMSAILLPVLLVSAALAIDIGHLFFVQRDLQKVADLSAVGGAQLIADAEASAKRVALENGLDPKVAGSSIAVTRGVWNPKTVTPSCPDWNPSCSTKMYFAASIAKNVNAVQVQVTRKVPYFFVLGSRQVSTGAVAWNLDAAGFSVATEVLVIDTEKSKLLNAILGKLLGVDLNLSAVGYQGLANTTVNLGKLTQALSLGTTSELLKARLDLPGLYQGVLTALNNQGVLVSSDAKGALASLLGSGISGSLKVELGEILKLSVPAESAALQANVNVLNLITAAAMVSNGKHFIDIPNVGINLPGLLKLNLGLNVISPPSFAFGPPGQNADGSWKTQAHTAQVRLQLLLDAGQLLGGLVHLPLYLEVAPGDAHLTSLSCAVPQTGNALQIGANTGLVTGIIGDIPPGALENTTQPLEASVQPATILNVLGLVKVTMAPLVLPLSAQGWNVYQPLDFNGLPKQVKSINTNAAGSAIGNLIDALIIQLNKPGSLKVEILGLGLDLGVIVGLLLQLLNPVLQLLTPVLDAVLVPVLQLLGIELGKATVTYNSVACNNAALVY